MTPLYLLRHGPTAASQAGAPLGRLDLPVTEEAERRWPLVKAHIQALGIQRVLCSHLRRSRAHAEDLGLPLLVLEGLAEQSFGAWEGVPWQEIKGAESFFANPVIGCPPGGESFARCASRAVQTLQGALSGEEPILVLAHGGSLRAILAHFMGLSLERALDLAWQPFGLSKLEIHGPNKAVLRFHNQGL
ncbi:MAG: histidine phosphatase family protein [Acidobacteria bacterium]|nr:histidine phosphatase family protein [Acidobacteriota bacterium]